MEPFDLDRVRALEAEGVPYTGARTKWWYRCDAGWVFATL
jgi:hypothetical protein